MLRRSLPSRGRVLSHLRLRRTMVSGRTAMNNGRSAQSRLTRHSALASVATTNHWTRCSSVTKRARSTSGVPASDAWERRHSNEFSASLRRAIKLFSVRGSFWAAETWVPDDDGMQLVPARAFKTLRGVEWREQHGQLLAERTALLTEPAGEDSVVHRAWRAAEVVWHNSAATISDEYAGAARSSFITLVEARTVVAVPIVVDAKVVAVMSFIAPDNREVNEELVQHMKRNARGLLESGLSGEDIGAPFKKEDYEDIDVPIDSMNEVFGILSQQGIFTDNVAYVEVDWFFRHLQFDPAYFRLFTNDQISQHLQLLIAAKRMADASGNHEDISLYAKLDNGGWIHVCPATEKATDAVESRIDEQFEAYDKSGTTLSLTMFRSKNPGVVGGEHPLLVYIVQESEFVNGDVSLNEHDLEQVSSRLFLEQKPTHVKKHYAKLLKETAQRLSPGLEIVADTPSGGKQLMFCFRGEATRLEYLSEMFIRQGLQIERKFVEQFANGLVVFSTFVLPCPDLEARIANVIHATSLLNCLPRSDLIAKFHDKTLTAEEYTYASSVARFAHYFITRQSEEYTQLLAAFQKTNDVENTARLVHLHSKLRTASVPPQRVLDCVRRHLPLVKTLFADFRKVSTDPLEKPKWIEERAREIRKAVADEIDERILLSFVRFNANVLKTNFFCSKKVSLAFRMSNDFIDIKETPEQPFAIFLVLGPTFQGFHLRFRDVSRGGIRLIPFTNQAAYVRNEETQYNENFNLAYTQNKKNKDIPEFGSKGTILIDPSAPRTAQVRDISFQHYISGLLDLIVPNADNVHGDQKVKVDHIGEDELLFLGPDENTADYMQWAAEYARYRGYRHWKSITTGKPPVLGGIPHDTYGMTTRSVHRYVVGLLQKLGLDETKITKLQTGGPDGDLGSNEITISHDRTTSIVDGSGVLHDPNGLNREELTRLAHARSTVDQFDTSKLSSDGFFVSVEARDIKLPSGENVESGLTFRNEFHLHPLSSADLFVPCGGRPEAINIQNVHQLFDEDSNPRFKYIVEGANLFITQDARLTLENAGVVLYKDASANKGGVTSSSLEVLAALSLTDSEFLEHMSVKDQANPPQFYQDYVQDVQNIIEENASLEFECIWRAHEQGLGPRTLLTDDVSDKINLINDFITTSTLYDDIDVRHAVMAKALPPTLIKLLGLETVLQRVPESYSRAVFSSYLASRYVYNYGINAPELAFYEFMRINFSQ